MKNNNSLVILFEIINKVDLMLMLISFKTKSLVDKAQEINADKKLTDAQKSVKIQELQANQKSLDKFSADLKMYYLSMLDYLYLFETYRTEDETSNGFSQILMQGWYANETPKVGNWNEATKWILPDIEFTDLDEFYEYLSMAYGKYKNKTLANTLLAQFFSDIDNFLFVLPPFKTDFFANVLNDKLPEKQDYSFFSEQEIKKITDKSAIGDIFYYFDFNVDNKFVNMTGGLVNAITLNNFLMRWNAVYDRLNLLQAKIKGV